jgi:hypothetical protein
MPWSREQSNIGVARDVRQEAPRREDAQARPPEDRQHHQDHQSAPLRTASISMTFKASDSARIATSMAQNDNSAAVIHGPVRKVGAPHPAGARGGRRQRRQVQRPRRIGAVYPSIPTFGATSSADRAR